MKRAVLAIGLAACAASRAPAGDERHALGMNDVSILLPLPASPAAPVLARLDDRDALIDRATFAAVVRDDLGPKAGEPAARADYHIVALRFDLCDREQVGACAPGAEGRLRLVLQPVVVRRGELITLDVALHAFYPIAADELPAMVRALRGLASRSRAPLDAPLGVSAAAKDPAYASALRDAVLRYARAERLVRLTVIGQHHESAAFAWTFRGVDRIAGQLRPIAIPGVATDAQTVQLAGGDTVYDAHPVVDAPAGFALALNGPRFAAASSEDRTAALGALLALQDPRHHETGNTQCLACHVVDFLAVRRAAALGVELRTVDGRFAAPYNLAVDSIARRDPRVVRAFGWATDAPVISQRVANDTAQVLAEIDARYPAR